MEAGCSKMEELFENCTVSGPGCSDVRHTFEPWLGLTQHWTRFLRRVLVPQMDFGTCLIQYDFGFTVGEGGEEPTFTYLGFACKLNYTKEKCRELAHEEGTYLEDTQDYICSEHVDCFPGISFPCLANSSRPAHQQSFGLSGDAELVIQGEGVRTMAEVAIGDRVKVGGSRVIIIITVMVLWDHGMQYNTYFP